MINQIKMLIKMHKYQIITIAILLATLIVALGDGPDGDVKPL